MKTKTRCFGCMEEYDEAYGLCPYCGYEQDAETDSPLHMRPGEILHGTYGEYLIGKVLGFGGFGVTYIGWDFKLCRKVAIKEYLPSEFATRLIGQTQVTVFGGKKEEQFDDGLERFAEEAKRLAKFQNEEGIVRIFDSFAENNTAYIVMEYLEGETLTACLERNGKIPADDAIAMLTPVLKSLETVHKAGIIHRDIAPDNIFLTKDGQVKLIDFGAARYATTSHSRSLSVIIKQGYSPEEQYRSRGDQGPHTDVYALAAVLYRMITGVVPPDSMERRARIEKNGKDVVEPVSKYCKIGKSQENAIMNALNVRVEDRTPTAAQFLEELTAQKPVKRIFGKIKAIDLMRWPLWAKILIPTAGAAVLTLLVLLFTGVIGPRGGLVTDVVLGENEARVPSIVNYSVDVAQDRLAEQSLDCRIIGGEYSDVIPANVVLYQSIVAGQVVEKDTVIEVYVSTEGSPNVAAGIMPCVIYRAEQEAVGVLESVGLTVKLDHVYDDLVAEGLVISQSLTAGTDIRNGGTVTLAVSSGVNPNKQEPSSELVVLSKESYDLYVGDSVNVHAKGGTGSYSYHSSDESVVKVDRQGKLTAVGVGTATVTVSSGKAKEAVCTVTVHDYEMALNPESLTLFVDASATLSVSGIPSTAEVSWSSEDSKIATVNDLGKVTGVSTGTTTVTATWKSGKNTYTASVVVTVEAEGITLSVYKISSFYVGETYTITANASSQTQTVKWESSDEKVAVVSADGVVTAVGGGSATITASVGAYSESCEVTVTQPSVSITKSSASLYIGDTTTLSASVTPSGTALTWSSDNSNVAQVSDGKVTASGAGTTTIRVKMTYAGEDYEATCSVTVTQPGVSLSAGSLALLPGKTQTLTAKTTPGGSSVSWSSSNTGVATVSGGTVTAKAVGTAKITAQITYNGKTYKATCNVTVANPSIKISSSTSTIEFSPRSNGTCTLTAKVTPDGGSVKWESSASSVASVSGNGTTATVTAKSEGTATITVTYSINGTTVNDSCTITVKKAASTLKIENFAYAKSGTVDSFWISGTLSSNYALTKVTCSGSATSNALGIKVSDTAEPYYFGDGVYSVDASVLRDYFMNQYRKLFELYSAAAGLLGADNSVTMHTTSTCYDEAGNSMTFEFDYVIYAD